MYILTCLMRQRDMLLGVLTFVPFLAGNLPDGSSEYRNHFETGLRYYREKNHALCEKHMKIALQHDPLNMYANGILGAVYIIQGHEEEGLRYLARSAENGGLSDASITGSYIEALRLNSQHQKAIMVYRSAIERFPKDTTLLLNGGLVLLTSGNIVEGVNCLLEATKGFRETNFDGWVQIMENLNVLQLYSEAELFATAALDRFPDEAIVVFNAALTFHYQKKFDQALDLYKRVAELSPDFHVVYTNMGAVYQAMGSLHDAKQVYERAFEQQKDDAGFLNNYGTLLTLMNEMQLGVKMLERALDIDPQMENAMVNLGSYYQDEGLLAVARDLFSRAATISPQTRLLQMRMALMMSPVVSSWQQMIAERSDFAANVRSIVSMGDPPDHLLSPLDSSMDRIHFYLIYSGLNDRFLQEEIAKMYRMNIRNLSKTCSNVAVGLPGHSGDNVSFSRRRVRVGFLSKFFGVYEPHGMLLEGVMRYLPRTEFEVFALPVAISDKPLSPIVENAADTTIYITLEHINAFHQICELKLDILVFADTLSEPMTHFLAHSRMATIQLAFWGNPVTSGSPYVDYFISGDIMEHPYRTRIEQDSEPYSEQIVLLPGQSIWYSAPNSQEYVAMSKQFNITSSRQFTREEFGFQSDWFIFFCPQSLFKMHPLFDQVLADILKSNPEAHVVMTSGRKERWTTVFLERLQKSLGPNMNRCHCVKRVSSEKFLQLLKISNVLLHPFPFDGSRTAADGIGTGIPYITLPAEYLRGRMGMALLRTLNMPELVAKNMSDYVRIATQLCHSPSYFKHIQTVLRDRADLIWEDMEYPFSWTQFLSTLSGFAAPDWNSFIANTGRNATRDTEYMNIRKANQNSFDQVWGPEKWLQTFKGTVLLPGLILDTDKPRIFTNWQEQQQSNGHTAPAALDTTEERYSDFIHASSSTKDVATAAVQVAAQSGNFDRAFKLGAEALKRFPSDPLLLLEMGVIQYFRGEYKDALALCESGAYHLKSNNSESSQIFGCIGVAAVYLHEEKKALSALRRAYDTYQDHSDITSSIFQFPKEAIEVSLTTALKTFARYQECASTVTAIMGIPTIASGGAYFILYSFVEWTEPIASEWGESGLLAGNKDLLWDNTTTFESEIYRLQKSYSYLLENARECIIKFDLDSVEGKSVQKAATALSLAIAPANVSKELWTIGKWEKFSAERSDGLSPGIALITQYYSKSGAYGDTHLALLKNLANPWISDIYLLNEEVYDIARFPHSHKIHQIQIGKRLTFGYAIQFINKELSGRKAILANADIYFDETVGQLHSNPALNFSSTVYSLGKWTDWNPLLPVIQLHPRIDSQDAWIFRSPLSSCVANAADFPVGLPRCDNRIAAILDECGYNVQNPLFNIHAVEVMSASRVDGLYSMEGAVVGEGKNVFLSSLL